MLLGPHVEMSVDVSDTLQGKELIKKLGAEQKEVGWTVVPLHLLMKAMLHEAEDALQHAEQEHIAQGRWEQLLVIETQRSELAKFAAASHEETQKLNDTSVVQNITALERKIAHFISETTKSVIQHAVHHCATKKTIGETVLKEVRLLVQNCHEEVQEKLDVEEKNKISKRQWADLKFVDIKKQALAEMTLEAFEKKAEREKHDLLAYLRTFCEEMIALVPDQSISVWKDISTFTGDV